MCALEARYEHFAGSALFVGATPLVVSKMSKGMTPAATRTSLGRTDTAVPRLLDVLLDRRPLGLDHYLHEAGE